MKKKPGLNDKFYIKGKFFQTFEEMMEYAKKWPDEPVDLNHYREFLDERFIEAQANAAMNPNFTNRTAFELLRMNTNWTEGL